MREIYQAKSFLETSTVRMLLEAEEASEKKALKKMNHEFKQFNSALSLDLHLTHVFSLTL